MARKRRSSPGYFWARVAVLFSQTGSRRWHQWHQGAKKLTIMICAEGGADGEAGTGEGSWVREQSR